MAYDPCLPSVEPGPGGTPTPSHQLVHHAIGRARHHIHHGLRASHRPVADACSKQGSVPGQPGGLPALPAGRVAKLGGLSKAMLGGVAAAGTSALLATAALPPAPTERSPATPAAVASPVLLPGTVPAGTPAGTVVPGAGGLPITRSTPLPGAPSNPAVVPPVVVPPGDRVLVPEPASLAILAASILALFGVRHMAGRLRFRRRQAP